MIKVDTSQRLPIKMWLDDLEESALWQAQNLANLPFTFRYVAIMPDAHCGFGMPIGGVLATKDVVIPNAVGVDIGCGMCAVRTDLQEISQEQLKKIMGLIRQRVPVGFNRHNEPQDKEFMPVLLSASNAPVCRNNYIAALSSLGTLGGGNHFIELQKGSDGFIWIMLHSGSRNLGKQVADFYNTAAKNVNKRHFSSVPESYDLAFLLMDSTEGRRYIAEMNFCVEYAFANRKLMLDRIKESFTDTLPTIFYEIINIAHNYARMENHFGENVMVHRKGATSARNLEIGIIPGSQGSKSYVVRGKGNIDSFMSCSHGAGRKMGRKQAKKNLVLADEISRLDSMGVLHAIRSDKDLDEAPGAYKDIDVVMKNQEDLVDILVELTPLAVIKG